MTPAIWFSRHTPTAEQLNEIADMGLNLVCINEGVALGSVNLNTAEDSRSAIAQLIELYTRENARAIFGVFPTPILAAMYDTAEMAVLRGDWRGRDVICFASWNVQRSADGGKPTFHHKQFSVIGRL